MSLDDFLGGAVVTRPVSGAGNEPTFDEVLAPSGSSEPAPETDETPQGVVELELPSGIEVYYQAAPKRLYRVRQALLTGDEPGLSYDWVEVPSISTVTKILDKPGLVHWGEKVGINLVQELLRQGDVDLDFVKRFQPNEKKHPPWFGGAHLQEIGKSKRLTNYYMRDQAATRGDSVHKALETWAMSGSPANPDVFPEEERGYVVGLNKFLTESSIIPIRSEVIVASTAHRIAGRFDLQAEMPHQAKLVYHLTEKNEKRKVFEPFKFATIDLKTSTGVFEDHHLQVAGYNGCLVDSGYPESEISFVLRVTFDGRYELVEVRAVWEDFWFLLGLYDGLQRIQGKTE